jgi:fumarate reductase flavoprotein subunit
MTLIERRGRDASRRCAADGGAWKKAAASAQTMQATCDTLAELKSRIQQVQLDATLKGWNTEWLLAIELDFQLDVAQAIAHSALAQESRGSHQRLDGFEHATTPALKHSHPFFDGDDAPRIALAVKIRARHPAFGRTAKTGDTTTR